MLGLFIKRVYDPAEPGDSTRILVDRLWPRGVSRQSASWCIWARDAAPSHELRRAFHGSPERWDEFRDRYWRELDARPQAVSPILDAAAAGPVTLLFAAHDRHRNNAAALRDYCSMRAGEDP